MRTWSLPLDAPLTLTLAADTRSADFDPDNDQIWQLTVAKNDPAGLAMESKYGLRAKLMRIVAAFTYAGQLRQNPADFHSSVQVNAWLPAYISLSARPFAGYELRAEYWVRSSSLLAGRFTVTNLSEEAIEPGLRLYSILQGRENAQPISDEVLSGVRILSGGTADLFPVVFLDGGARSEPAPYPALGVSTLLSPGESHSWIWAHSAGDSVERSFENCRKLLDENWDADVAKLIMEHSDMLDVQTGDINWDAALWAAQRDAQMLFLRPNRRLKHAVPVQRRTVKQGNPGGSGASPWEPANPWEAFHAGLQLLTASPERLQGYIQNLLRLQEGSGHIPAMTDFATPREGWLYPPLLAQLVLRLYKRTENEVFLKETFQSLFSFFERWFSDDHDRDEDGYPEWDHVNQAGFKTWPAFSPWYGWSKGLDIATAETVDLATLLILEGDALMTIADLLGMSEPLEILRARIHGLRERVEQSWAAGSGYKHMDYYLDESVAGKRLGVRRGSFSLDLNREFDPAVRVLFQIEGEQERAKELIVRIHSRGRRGPSRVEEYNFRKIDWFLDYGYLTSEKPSAEIERIELEGLDRDFRTTVSLGDYSREDITLLIPLAAGIPSDDRADQIVREILMDDDRYWRPGGIPCVPADDPDYAGPEGQQAGTVDILKNHWIGEGLLAYGYHQEASDLFSRLMDSVVHALAAQHAFPARYDPEIDRSGREEVSASGLTPLALLLQILGVELISPRKLRVRPGNPFPNPISLHWKGLRIVCDAKKTLVVFPDGQRTEVTGESLQTIEQIG